MDADSPTGPRFLRSLRDAWSATRLWLIFGLGLAGTVASLALTSLQSPGAFLLEVGDVSPQDIAAPFASSFESEVLTEQARLAAEQSVPNVYDPPDSSIAREQLNRLQETLGAISAIRSDSEASLEQKLNELTSLGQAEFNDQIAQSILDVPDSRWNVVMVEAASSLQQVMRSEIREGEEAEALRMLPTLVSIAMSESQAQLVVELVSPFIAPNALLNQAETEQAREQAREAVAPISRSFVEGETIIGRGEVVTASDLEALSAFGLLTPPDRWRSIALQALMVTVLASAMALYAYRVSPEFLRNIRMVAITAALLVSMALAMSFAIPARTVLPYLFPAATIPMLLAILIGPGMGIMSAIISGALAGFLASRGLEIGLYYLLSGVLGSLMIGRAERLSVFVWAGLAADLAAVAVVVVFRFPDPATDMLGKASLLGAGLLTGLLSASLAFGLGLLISSLLGLPTNIQLIELSRPDHPLLQLLLRSAPGSYQHSLQVANLAEQAARAIGANPLLTRVGALYHDVGKALRPQFFIENQIPGQNIHEQLDPATSSSMILGHVPDGLELARKYRLPQAISDFIPEHHGTLETSYQYHAALQAAEANNDSVDRADFTYPGPRPRTRETAILMLADGVEAKSRADMPEDEEAIAALVRWVIEDRLAKRQLDRTDLTLKDLDTIRRSFISTLKSIYHPRIRYPESEPAAEADPVPVSEPEQA